MGPGAAPGANAEDAGREGMRNGGVRFSRIALPTGVELHVAERGPASGRPVLLLHGYTDSWFSWSPILDLLPPDARAIVPSQRGHGDSDRPQCCYRFADYARDAVALLDELGIERADVVGHSMGSFVAQKIAIDYPDRVNGLVLVGSGAAIRNPAVEEFGATVMTLTDPVSPQFIREFQAGTAHEPLRPALLDGLVRETGQLPARIWRDAMNGMLAGDMKTELRRIRARTLIVWGVHDGLFGRADQDALVAAIPNAELLVYDDAAHSPNWEFPERFAADLSAFLNGAATTAGSAAVRREHANHAHGESARPGAARDHDEHGNASSSAVGPMPLLDGLGDWHYAITTSSSDAPRYFDQGLRLAYAFNHDEAVRSFERAVQLDSACAMCWWGIAYALGPNINLPMDAAIEPRALAAARRAVSLARGVKAAERGLIRALALRYGEPAGASRAARDSAYAIAMGRVAIEHPDDADAQVLFADAMLNLRPWNQWTRGGQPQPGTLKLVAALERVLEAHPTHAGACHFYVHAVEASPTPERALPCAERLPRLMPGAGHVVHMPAHIYLRVGRYEDAARANIAAVEADANYFARHEVTPGVYPMFYAPHNLHFLWAAYMLSGQKEMALGAARALVDRVDPQDARGAAALEGFLPSAALTHVRFGDWKAALVESAPPSDLRYAKAMWHYARGVAHAGRNDLAAAAVELDSVRTIASQVSDDMIIIMNPAPSLLRIAAEVLAGVIASRQERWPAAVDHFRGAVRMEDALTYDEPPPWYHSARNLLGETLLRARRYAEAEQAFREDVWYLRENGWSLSGLERALRAQGKGAEAHEVSRRLEKAWMHADSPARPAAGDQDLPAPAPALKQD
jgi:pimeloyl-ACP methyl ester carboxylesterase